MIEININKSYNNPAGDFSFDIKCAIKTGSIVSIYGDSGAGKTTLLRLISGLSTPDSGYIKVKEENLYNSSKKIDLSPQKRNIGFIFQENALFPNMNVLENMRYALKKKESDDWLQEIIKLMQLEPLLKRSPDSLSGGQKQRVSLARSLVAKPQILLLDEPLSALDKKSRKELQDLIQQINRRLKVTILLVSHDVHEISRLADEVIYLKDGKLIEEEHGLLLQSNKETLRSIELIGEIKDIIKGNDQYRVIISMESHFLELDVSVENAKSLSIGNRIKLSTEIGDHKFQILK